MIILHALMVQRQLNAHEIQRRFKRENTDDSTSYAFGPGHGSSKTIERYTHVSLTDFNKFKNPMDAIEFEDP